MDTAMTVVAVGVIAATIAILLIMLCKGNASPGRILAMGVVGIAAGCAIPNLTKLASFQMTAQGINAEMTAKVKEARSIEQEVRRVEQRVESLAKGVETTNNQVKASQEQIATLVQEADQTKRQATDAGRRAVDALAEGRAVEGHVTAMQANMQQTWRSLLESYALAIGTRNIFPTPSNISNEIDKHLNVLASFAYPDVDERNREVARIMQMIKAAQDAQ